MLGWCSSLAGVSCHEKIALMLLPSQHLVFGDSSE